MSQFMESLVSAWGGALLNFLWQGLLIGVVTAFVLRLSRQARPQVRYAIACLALLLCFTLPIIGVWHALSIDIVNDSGFVAMPASINLNATLDSGVSADTVTSGLYQQLPWIVIAWSLGCAFFSLRMAMGLSWISNARRHSLANANGSLQSKLNLLAIQFDVRRPVQLLICNDIDSPVTAGWWKPVVLVPAALASRLPPDYIEALLAHELAHIKRHDYLVNLIQSFIEAVLFFHPAVWWLSKQIRIERENIADDLAAEVLGEPRQLAVALAALDEFQFAGPLLAPAAHGGNLMSRIQRLIKPTQHVLSWKMSALLIGLTLACITVYARDKTSISRKSEASAVSAAAAVEAVDAVGAVEASEAAEVMAADAATAAADEATAAADAETAAADAATEAADEKAAAADEAEAEAADKADDADESGDVTINNMPRHETYALVTAGKEGVLMSGSSDDIAAVKKARKSIAGDFLWFRRNGKTYVVQDAAVISEAKAAWKDSEKLSVQMEALSAKMDVHSKVMDGIGVKMDAVSKGSEGRSDAMEKTGQQMEVLGKQQETIGKQMSIISQRSVLAKTEEQHQIIAREMQVQEEKMAVLSQQMQKLSIVMDQHGVLLEKQMKPLETLGREMEVASLPLKELGQQMSVLGKQQERLSKLADEKVLNIIDSSLKNGQALPSVNFAPK
ncbi:MAG: M56 family metallopeptidase [Arenimonas sp.]